MLNHRLAAACALTLAACGFASTSHAGVEGKDLKAPKELQEVVKESCITGDIGVQVVSQYITRGFVLENQGVIAQPFVDLYFKLYSGDGFINSVTLNLGLWSSLHSEKTDQGLVTGTGTSSTPAWYEFDYTAGISVGFAKNFTLTGTYLEYNYPNDGFLTQRFLQAKLAYNDADLFGKFALNPYVKYEYYLETPDGGHYFEGGVSPGFAAGPVQLNFPLTVGFGTNQFYGEFAGNPGGEDHFGYASGGVVATYTLGFINECYGVWKINAGYTYYYLDSALEGFNTAERGGLVRDSDNHEHVFSGGIIVAF